MKPGDVILVQFPFTNLEHTKKRPALLLRSTALSGKAQLVTLAMITSKVDGLKLEGDVHLANWAHAKLLHPSLVRLAKIATVDADLIDKVLGHLVSADRKAIQKNFRKLFHEWI